MELTHVLLRRAAAISLAGLLCVLLLAVWRAQSDVRREALGAAHFALLSRQLAALQNAPDAAVEERIRALRDVGRLRHLEFRLEDAGSGEMLARSLAEDAPPAAMQPFLWLQDVFSRPQVATESTWLLERADGRSFRVKLTTQPFSEQREAFDDVVGVTGVLLLYGLGLLAALYWAVRHAFAPLRPILDAIGAFERQDYRLRLPAMPIREMDVIARALNHLAAALGQIQEERRLLSLKLLTLQEDERTHIARELHDELGQSLTAMRVDAAFLLRRTAQLPELHAVAAELEQQCARVQQDVRNLLRWLGKPGDVAHGEAVRIDGLLGPLIESWRNRPGQTGAYHLAVEPDGCEIPQALALTLYRMTQEALTNVARHAEARTAVVTVKARPGAGIEWSVRDDGIGIAGTFREAALQQGNGLAGIRERVWAQGGELEMLDSAADDVRPGFWLVARFSWPKAGCATSIAERAATCGR